MKIITLKPSDKVEFHEPTHRYFLKKNGKELHGVSKIYKIARADSQEVMAQSGELGVKVHELAHLYVVPQDIDRTIFVPGELTGYDQAIRSFFKRRVKRVLLAEAIAFDAKLGIAGRLDILYEDHAGKICLDDYKTDIITPTAKLKAAVYTHLVQQTYIAVDETAIVRLNPNGIFNPKKDRMVINTEKEFKAAMVGLEWSFWLMSNQNKRLML